MVQQVKNLNWCKKEASSHQVSTILVDILAAVFFVTTFIINHMTYALGMTRSNISDIDKTFKLLCKHTFESVSYFWAALL